MWPIQLAFLVFIVCMIFLSSLTVCNTSSFLTRLVQLTFCSLYRSNITDLSIYLWTTLRSVQVSAPYISVLQMQHFSSFLLEFNSNLLVKRVFSLNPAFVMAILYLISSVCRVTDKYGLSEGLKVSWVIVCVPCDRQVLTWLSHCTYIITQDTITPFDNSI
jgi:hypothetical protein